MKCFAPIALSFCFCAEAQELSFEQRVAELDAKLATLEKLFQEREKASSHSSNQVSPLLEPGPVLPIVPKPISVPAPISLSENSPTPNNDSISTDGSRNFNSTRDLSLFQAIELALKNIENLAVYQARLDTARARLRAVGKTPSPEIRFRHDGSRFAGESSQEYALRLRFNNPWETEALREEGQARTEVARFQLQLAERFLVTEVTKLYFETIFRQGDVFFAREIAKAQSTIRSTQEALFNAGQLTLPKILESRLKTSQKASEVAEAEHASENATATLRTHLDLPENQPINLVTSFTQLDTNATAILSGNSFDRSILGRPEILSLESESDAALARIRQVRARQIPWFSFVQASLEHDRRVASDSNQWGFLLGFDIPLWGRQTDLQAAAAELQETRSIERLARRDLRLALATARRNYQTSLRRLVERETSVAILEGELAPGLSGAQDGLGVELVVRQRLLIGLLEARRDLFEARYQHQSARLSLEEALGYSIK